MEEKGNNNIEEKEEESKKKDKKDKKTRGADKRNRKTKIYDDVKKNFRSNFLALIGDSKQADVAKALEVHPSRVSAWCAEDTRLPPVDMLVLIARYYGVTTDWLLSEHSLEDRDSPDHKGLTYAEALESVIKLTSYDLLDASSVDDYFLSYLLRRTSDIRTAYNLSDEKKDDLYKNLLLKYRIPIQEKLPADTYKNIEKNFGVFNEDVRVLSVLKVVANTETGFIRAVELDKIRDAASKDNFNIETAKTRKKSRKKRLKKISKSGGLSGAGPADNTTSPDASGDD